MSTRHAIEHRLNDLIGMPVWGISQAASLVMLQFGDRLRATSPLGRRQEVGTYALHIDCPWSWQQNGEVLADQDSDFPEIERLISSPIVCKGIKASESGSFELRFDNGTKLVVSVDDNVDPEADEYWRLLEPALDAPQFVIGPKGVQA